MRKWITCYLVLAMVAIGVVPPVEASFLSSETITTGGSDRSLDLQTVREALETKLVRQRLADLGFTPEEVRARIAQLSDQQIHQVAQRLDEVRVGQDGFGILIGLLVIAGLVVLIYYLLTHQVVIK
ncbi:MAG: PA2779 family protein [Syntrophorhabdales bacterium]|jgi:hypothetical protein